MEDAVKLNEKRRVLLVQCSDTVGHCFEVTGSCDMEAVERKYRLFLFKI